MIRVLIIVNNPGVSSKEVKECVKYWKGKVDFVIQSKFRSYAGHFKVPTSIQRYPCLNLFTHPAINFKGDMMICCQAFNYLKKAVIGNINELTIEEIWKNNKALNKLRLEQLNGRYDIHPVCRRCTSWENYPNIWPIGTKLIVSRLYKSKYSE